MKTITSFIKTSDSEDIACINFLGLCVFGVVIVVVAITSMITYFAGFPNISEPLLQSLQPISWGAWIWVLTGLVVTGIKQEFEVGIMLGL